MANEATMGDYSNAMRETIQDRISRLMTASGHNMKSLSLATGLGETAVRDILVRNGTIKISTLEALSRVLGVDVATLVSGNVDLTAEEAALLEMYRNLTPEQREIVRAMSRQMQGARQSAEADVGSPD